MLTSDTANVRVLGESRAPKTPTRALLMASGNNVRVRGDMVRRVLYCRLYAGVAQPELRRFDFNAFEEVNRHRPELVSAALLILRAYAAAGRPKPAGHVTLGSYEAWDDLVRGAILWLGGADPVATQEGARHGDEDEDGDEDAERNRAVLEVLVRTFRGQEFRTDESVDCSTEIARWLPGASGTALRGGWSAP